MVEGNDNLIGRLSKSVRNNKRGFAILVLVAMVVSFIGGVLPSVDGLANNGEPKSYLNLDNGPGKITLSNISGEQSPIWQKGSNQGIQSISRTAALENTDEDSKGNSKGKEMGVQRRLLEGAEFTITSLDEVVGDEVTNHDIQVRMITDKNGEFEIEGLPIGRYMVKEVVPPTGYEILENDSIVLEITGEDRHAHLIFQNKELQVSPSISKEWTEGSEPVNYNIDYQYYGVDGEVVKNSDVNFNTDLINIGNVFYFTPRGDVNRINVTNHKVDARNHEQYEYELVKDVHNVKFLGDQIKRHIVVKKDFDGLKAEDVKLELIELEEDVDIKDSNKVVGSITLNEKNNWAHTFKDMPRYTDEQLNGSIADRRGQHIEYGVREVDFTSEADGYASVVRGNEIDSFVIVNKQLEDIDVVIDKVWVGASGNSSKFEVNVDGEVWETVSMTSKDDWTKTVPLKGVPYDAEVTVTEIETDEAYDVNVIEKDNNKFVVEGIERVGSLEVLMNKGTKDPKMSMVYVDRMGDNRVNSINLFNEDEIVDAEEENVDVENTPVESTRLAGAKFLIESKEVEENAEGEEVSIYTKEITTNKYGLAVLADIPFGDYTITEIESPKGYELGEVRTIDFTVGENQTRSKYRADFYNERAKVDAQDLDIKITKEWEFKQDISGFKIPEEVKMKLVSKLPNGEVHEESEVFVLNEGNDWTKEFTGMSNVNNTNEYKELDFSVVEINETDVDYELHIVKTGSYFNNEGNKVDILATNVEALGKIEVIKIEGTKAPTTDFEIDSYSKAVDGARFELREKENDKLVRESSTTKNGEFSMVNLPYGDYVLKEIEAPKGYLINETDSINITIDEAQTRGQVNVKFENEPANGNSVNVNVKTEWKDSKGKNLNLDLVKDKEFKVELYRNDIEQDKFVTLNAKNDWKATFESLRKYEVGSKDEFKYSVKEIVEKGSSLDTGYKTEVKGNAKDGYVIVNTQIDSDVIDIPVVKKWMGGSKELDKVTFQLKASDKVVKELTVTADDNWKGVFKDIPVKDSVSNETIKYTLVELDHEGYLSSVYGNADTSGYEVRNTQLDFDGPVKTRDINVKIAKSDKMPEYVDVTLYADGEAEEEVRLSEDNDFKHIFKDYRQINVSSGKDIVYTVIPAKVDGYGIKIDGDMGSGFIITMDKKSEDKPNNDKGKPNDEGKNDDKKEGPIIKVSLKDVYDKINGKTTYEDVKKLMGRDGTKGKIDSTDKSVVSDMLLDMSEELYYWTQGDDYLQVGFTDGVADLKAVSIGGNLTAAIGLKSDEDKEDDNLKDPNAEYLEDENPDGEEPEKLDDEGNATKKSKDGFKQTATSAIGLGLFALAGLAGAGAAVYKKKKED